MRRKILTLFSICAIVSSIMCGTTQNANAAASDQPFTVHTSIQDVQKYVAARPDQFGGLYVDETGTVHVLTVAATTPSALAALRELPAARSMTSGPSVAASRVQLRQVAHSTADLETVKSRITTAQPWATDIKGLLVSWGIRPSTNKVLVQLSRVSDKIKEEAARLFGDSVEIEQSSRAHARDSLRKVPATPKMVKVGSPTVAAHGAKSAAAAEAGPPLLDSLPYIAGDRMVRTINRADGAYVDECTAAFPWDTGSGIEMASAGHCGPTGTNYEQGYYSASDNTIYYTGSMGNEYVSAFRENGVDAMLMSNPGNYYPLMWENTSGTYQTAQVTYSANPYEGQIVCFNGSFSGTRCGGAVVVPDDCLALDGIWPETGDPYELNMCNETETQAASMLDQDGDSGGPVFYGHPADGVGAEGIISAGDDAGTTAWFANGFGARANFVGDFAHF